MPRPLPALIAARPRALAAIRIAHTLIWALIVACIVALPIAAAYRRFPLALTLAAVVLAESILLAAFDGRCPLTFLAARWTADRSTGFDIYLPGWLARHNKSVFGGLYAAGLLWTLYLWLFRS